MVPPEAEAGFDIRIPPTVSMDVMQATLNSWLPADGSVAVTFHARVGEHNVTSIDPAQVAMPSALAPVPWHVAGRAG